MGRTNAYLRPPPTKSELSDELSALWAKIAALAAFQKTLAFAELPLKQKSLAEAQLRAMQVYDVLLSLRLDEWEDEL